MDFKRLHSPGVYNGIICFTIHINLILIATQSNLSATSVPANFMTTNSANGLIIKKCLQTDVNVQSEIYWLQVATFYAKCADQFQNQTASSDDSPTCSTVECHQCMHPCGYQWNNITKCKSLCPEGTMPCQKGCEMFADVLVNITEASFLPTTIISPPRVMDQTPNDFSLTWPLTRPIPVTLVYAVYSSPTNLLYEGFAVTTKHVLSSALHMSCDKEDMTVEKMYYKVIAVCEYGWLAALNTASVSQPIAPQKLNETVSDLAVVGSPVYKVPEEGIIGDHLKFDISWSIPKELSGNSGFAIKVFPCCFTPIWIEDVGNDATRATITLSNKGGPLADCNITITVFPKQKCFTGKGSTIEYSYRASPTKDSTAPATTPAPKGGFSGADIAVMVIGALFLSIVLIVFLYRNYRVNEGKVPLVSYEVYERSNSAS